MECAFNIDGKCSAGCINVFGCPEDCKFFRPNVETKNIEIANEDREIINVCKRIRVVAAMGRVDTDIALQQHTKSDNQHLVKFIEMCGWSFHEFIIQYLSNVQPFQLILDKSQQFDKSVKCIIDLSYSLALYIKIEFVSNDSILISFHENQNNKIKKYRMLKNSMAYAITKTDAAIGTYKVFEIKIAHGLLIFQPELMCYVVDHNLIKFSAEDLSRVLLLYANMKVDDLLQNSDSGVSFSTINDISLIVDALSQSRFSAWDKRILIIALNNKLFELAALPDYEEYLLALNQRYSKKAGSFTEKQRIILGLE